MATIEDKGLEQTQGERRAKRPLELSARLAGYLLKNKLKGKKRFPLVTMLEPLEM